MEEYSYLDHLILISMGYYIVQEGFKNIRKKLVDYSTKGLVRVGEELLDGLARGVRSLRWSVMVK